MADGLRRPLAIAAALVAVAVAIAALAGAFSGDDGEQAESGDESPFGQLAADTGPVLPPPTVRRYDVGGHPSSISAGAGYVWAVDSQSGSLDRINSRSKRPIAVETAGFPTDVSAGEGAAWLALADGGAVQRVTGTEGAGEPDEVAGFPFRVAAGEGSVWAMSQTSVERVDPATGTASEPVELDRDLASIAAGEGAVWVAARRRGPEARSGDRRRARRGGGPWRPRGGDRRVGGLGARCPRAELGPRR